MIRRAVFTRFGEISYTPADFNCFLEDFKGDLNERERYLFSSDDWRLGDLELKHEVREVEVPDWLPEGWHEEFFRAGRMPNVLRAIARYPDRPFYQSLINFLRERGYLTPKQMAAVLRFNR